MLKAVLFDLDDTLLDWEPFEEDFFVAERANLRGVFAYVQHHHQLDVDFDSFVKLQNAITVDVWLEAGETLEAPHIGRVLLRTFAQLGLDLKEADIKPLLQAYNWRGLPGVKPFREVPKVVPALRKHGVKTGIITNAFQPMWMRDNELEQLAVPLDWFDCRISTADFGRLKPHPAVFQHALTLLGAMPDEAVFIGDSLKSDVAGAQSAGIKAIWRQNGAVTRDDGDRVIVPDSTIKSLTRLPAILDKWFPGWRE